MNKTPRYKNMKTNSKVNCPHYEGDGYVYKFDAIEFNFCDICNNKLFIQMLDQKRIEERIKKLEEKNE